MGLFDSLPDRPLKRSEIDQLEGTRAVSGVFPIYDELNPNTAHGLAIVLNGTLYAWAYAGEWVELDETEVDASGPGVPFDSWDTVKEFQAKIADAVGAEPV